jgi:hypothetical protein
MPWNIEFIFTTFLVLNELRSNDLKAVSENILCIFVTRDVSNFEKSALVRAVHL